MMVRYSEHEWNGHEVRIRKLKVKESRDLIKLISKVDSSEGAESFDIACEVVDSIVVSVDDKAWDEVVDTDELGDFAGAAIGFFAGAKSQKE